MVSNVQPLKLHSWQKSFYKGERLLAEIDLLGASALHGSISSHQLKRDVLCAECRQFWLSSQCRLLAPSNVSRGLSDPVNSADSRAQYLLAADCPDALLLWALIRHFSTDQKLFWQYRVQILDSYSSFSHAAFFEAT